jgi:heme/copper-type cytochrome/quinol oxidase subunit 2
MKELTPGTVIAVFEEIFGPFLFWAMVVAAAIVTVLFLYVIIRDHKVESSRLVRAELWAPVGAISAILFVQFMTSSGFSDLGGPIDVIAMIAIGAAGAVGVTVLAYVVQAFIGGRLTSSQSPAD